MASMPADATTARRYVHVRYPWRAAVERRARAPARFYTAVIGQALRYGLPASRTPGAAWALAARAGLPEGALAAAIRRLPGQPRLDLDRLLALVDASWPELAGRSPRLPPSPPPLSALVLQRSAALTVFAFGEGPQPLLVLKIPSEGDASVDRELSSLREAELAAVAPRPLGTVGDARVQEGLEGAPLRVEPLTPARAARFEWTPALADVAHGLARLGRATAKSGPPEEVVTAMEKAVTYEGLDARTRDVLAAAWSDVRRSECCVLRHRDSSPQNCLMVDGRLTGIIDWEMAVPRGGPGFDVLNVALSYMEHGVGLARWSPELVLETFTAAWRRSGFWREARDAARDAARAAGARERDLDSLEVVFFGSRIGDRLQRPGWHPTGPATVARALRVVCAG